MAYRSDFSIYRPMVTVTNPDTVSGFERALAVLVGILILPVIVAVGVGCLIVQGRPIFVRLDRMNGVNSTFKLLKFRTLPVEDDLSCGVANRDRLRRIPKFCKFLRRTRLDEFPQIVNVILGDIGFVGPRPPEPCHVASHPRLFEPILRARPGITGLGTVIFSAYERRIIGQLGPARAEAVYARRILPRKLALERIFIRRRTSILLGYVLYLTLSQLLPLPGRRACRLRRLSGHERQVPPDKGRRRVVIGHASKA